MAVGDAHVFPGFLTPVLTQLFFPKPPTHASAEVRKYGGKKSRLNRGSNSQPPGHESDTLTTEPRRGQSFIELKTKLFDYLISSVRPFHERNCFTCHNKVISLNSVKSPFQHSIVSRHSKLRKLDPFLDKNGILRVGGRIRMSDIPDSTKHPAILPRNGHITQLIIRHFHAKTKHQGRRVTVNTIKSHDMWIIGCSSAVSFHITKCVVSRTIRSLPQSQKMADLLLDRLEPAPPFTYCAVDLFGLWYVKEGRK